jgi:hypothetical protein
LPNEDAVIAVFASHDAAEMAVRKLARANFEMKKLSLVGRGFHSEERVMGYYNVGDRIKSWGTQGAFWGGVWGLFLGGVIVTGPVVGPVVVLGYLATSVAAALEGAIIAGGAGALAAGLFSIGIPTNSIIDYETVLKQDGFMIMVHGDAEDVLRAKAILSTANATRIDVHPGPFVPVPILVPIPIPAKSR